MTTRGKRNWRRASRRRILLEELRHIANEPNCADIIKVLEEEKLLHLFSPDLAGAKLNHAGLQKLQKARQLVPFGIDIHLDAWVCSCIFSPRSCSPKERAAFIKSIGLSRREVDQWQKLEAKAKKLEKDLKSAKLQKPSKVYQVLSAAPGDQMLFLLAHSSERMVHDRIKNYLGKYLPTAQEVTERDVLATGVKPGTPKFQKAREELILTRLDARPKKIPPPEETPGPGGTWARSRTWWTRAQSGKDTLLDRAARRDPRWRESPCKRACWFWLRSRHAGSRSCATRGFRSWCGRPMFPKSAAPANHRSIMCGVWRKQKAFAVPMLPGEVVLGADTTVVIDDQVLEKPRDTADAVRMLALLSGREHAVITGICLRTESRKIVDAATTRVRFVPLTPRGNGSVRREWRADGQSGRVCDPGIGVQVHRSH